MHAPTPRARIARARGIALVLVLWVIALLVIVLGGFVVLARTENLQTRHLFDSARARYAAEDARLHETSGRLALEVARQRLAATWGADAPDFDRAGAGRRTALAGSEVHPPGRP